MALRTLSELLCRHVTPERLCTSSRTPQSQLEFRTPPAHMRFLGSFGLQESLHQVSPNFTHTPVHQFLFIFTPCTQCCLQFFKEKSLNLKLCSSTFSNVKKNQRGFLIKSSIFRHNYLHLGSLIIHYCVKIFSLVITPLTFISSVFMKISREPRFWIA